MLGFSWAAPALRSFRVRTLTARHAPLSSSTSSSASILCRALRCPSDEWLRRSLSSASTTTTASSSRSTAVPAWLAARLRLLPARLIDGSLETIMTAYARNSRRCDVFIRGLPRFDILAVYDEIITQRTRGVTFPSWERLLAEIKPAPLLHAANKLLLKDPAKWGPRFTRKKDAIRCLLDERDGLGEGVADFCKAHEVEWSKESMKTHHEWNRPSNWIPTPDDLRARGHFPEIFAGFLSEATDSSIQNSQAAEYKKMLEIITSILGLREDYRDESSETAEMLRDHLLRHHGSWDQPDRGGCLDELHSCTNPREIAGFAEMEPPELINVLRERTRLQNLGPDVHYDRLDDLQGTSSLAMLRCKYEIEDAGKRLRNCARSYASQVQMCECVLVELRDASGKPTAIGQFDMAKAEWVQIRETCNRMPTDATRAAFIGYTAVIQA